LHIKLRDYQINLINDVAKAWRAGYKKPCIVLPCGGGKSIIAADMAKRTTDNNKNVLFLVHRKELCEQIENTFTDYGVNMDLCQIGMVQTITRRTNKINKPNLIITDENHHCIANSYKKIYNAYPDVYCVGVTATPVRLNGGGLGEINDKLIIGPSVKDLIAMNCLADYDYYAPPVADLTGLRSRAGDYVAEDIEQALSKPKIYGDVIKYYRELSDGKQAICYCPTINYSKMMVDNFKSAGISAEHIDGNTPKNKRAEIIDNFRLGNIKILCNVDLVGEGFDVPDCNTSILLRPTKSLSLYIQQSMRCMRYKPGKRATIIDHVGNVHRFGLPSQDRVWTLEPKPVSKREGTTVKVKQCDECFFTHTPAPICPNCGHIYAPERKSPKEVKDARLKKINETVKQYTKPEQCGSFAELAAWGKQRGYKPGWAYHQAKSRGLLYGK
jgi:superfamily II DNA or RNA helicase